MILYTKIFLNSSHTSSDRSRTSHSSPQVRYLILKSKLSTSLRYQLSASEDKGHLVPRARRPSSN